MVKQVMKSYYIHKVWNIDVQRNMLKRELMNVQILILLSFKILGDEISVVIPLQNSNLLFDIYIN